MNKNPKLSLKAIAAMSTNRVIGYKNTIPWNLPEELKWFRQKTLGQTIVMGRKTFESIGGKPLPKRHNVIISSQTHKSSNPNLSYIINPEDIFALSGDVWICGGESVYRYFLPHCEELFLTIVKRTVEGDTFFPPFETFFSHHEVVQDNAEFEIQHWKRLC